MASPVTDPAIIAQLEGGPRPVTDPAVLGQLDGTDDKSTLQKVREAIHAPTRVLENGFLLGLGDRARAGIGAIIGDGSYGSNLNDERAQTSQYEKEHPIAAPVINAVGST